MVKSWRALKDVGTGMHKYKVYQIMTHVREKITGKRQRECWCGLQLQVV